MKLILALVYAGGLLAASAHAQSPVTVTIDAAAKPTAAIPADFVGLSFGMRALPPNGQGAHFFSPTNAPLVTLFRNIGIHHLRLGGTTVEYPPSTPIPGTAEIDDLFAFVRAAGVQRVIYSFRLLETEPGLHYAETNAVLAKYIWDRYRAHLDCFALGNEPDHKKAFIGHDISITNFATYFEKWLRFAAVITNAVPGAKFAGPDACSGRVEWTTDFARAGKNSGLVAVVNEHFYVGEAGRGKPAPQAIEEMLSPNWITANERIYTRVAMPVFAEGFPFRFTEASDHYSGGVPDASNAFAGALWALDFLHWWAAHGACGVNFHNTQWVVNDVITPDADGQLMANPKGYGLRAFELGSQGSPEPATVSNSDGLNLTAYAMRGSKEHFVTLINKEHGAGAKVAKVTLVATGSSRPAEVIYLTAPNGDASAKAGVTLGGDAIANNRPWRGKWTRLQPDPSGRCVVSVPATSAAIVKLAF